VPLTYVEHVRNFGEHNAVMTGLRLARGAYVINMDDDLQNPPRKSSGCSTTPASATGTWSTPLCHQAACRLAQSGLALRQPGRGYPAG